MSARYKGSTSTIAAGSNSVVVDSSRTTVAGPLAIDASTSLAAVALQVTGDPDTGMGAIGGANTISLVAAGAEILQCALPAGISAQARLGNAFNTNAHFQLKTDSKTWDIGSGAYANGDDIFNIYDGSSIRFAISTTGNISLGVTSAANTAAVLATNATAGFTLIQTCAGTPTGAAPDGSIVLDTTGSKWWARVGGTWKGVVVA